MIQSSSLSSMRRRSIGMSSHWSNNVRYWRYSVASSAGVVSQDAFQKELDIAKEGFPGVAGIADDNFVYGYTRKNMKNIYCDWWRRPEGKELSLTLTSYS